MPFPSLYELILIFRADISVVRGHGGGHRGPLGYKFGPLLHIGTNNHRSPPCPRSRGTRGCTHATRCKVGGGPQEAPHATLKDGRTPWPPPRPRVSHPVPILPTNTPPRPRPPEWVNMPFPILHGLIHIFRARRKFLRGHPRHKPRRRTRVPRLQPAVPKGAPISQRGPKCRPSGPEIGKIFSVTGPKVTA